jgi:hypothetical protein
VLFVHSGKRACPRPFLPAKTGAQKALLAMLPDCGTKIDGRNIYYKERCQ